MDVTRTRGLTPPPPAEVTGAPDGPDVVLASGVRIRRRRLGPERVSDAELAQAVQAVRLLPLQHQLLLARADIAIELVPAVQLEQVPGTTDAVLGATAITRTDGNTWVPTRIRVATRSPLSTNGGVNGIAEVTQHEVGHAIAVLASQDRSEQAARQYAQRY